MTTFGEQSPRLAHGRTSAATVVVHVQDSISAGLAGHDGCTYQSPPQPRDEAMSLIRILLGRSEEPPVDERGPWICPIAGGRRTVTLEPVHSPGN